MIMSADRYTQTVRAGLSLSTGKIACPGLLMYNIHENTMAMLCEKVYVCIFLYHNVT